jgi:carbamate kinase
MESKLAVIAIGGNSLINEKKAVTFDSQYGNVYDTCKHIIKLIEKGYKVVITHGNGPQVGFVLRRAELAKHELHMIPLDACGANTQGSIGYQIQRAMLNCFKDFNIPPKTVATIVTQCLVDKEDPSFLSPSKPIGSFMSKDVALAHKASENWNVIEDAGRGWRRVVASPLPKKILEIEAIKMLLENDMIVIAAGGGGIPVIETDGNYWGAEAVIDKDFATCLLAKELNADLFIISTAVDEVYLNFHTDNAQKISEMNTEEAKQYIDEGHFAKGSMLPKIKACIDFVDSTGNKALITSPKKLYCAMEGNCGTYIVP